MKSHWIEIYFPIGKVKAFDCRTEPLNTQFRRTRKWWIVREIIIIILSFTFLFSPYINKYLLFTILCIYSYTSHFRIVWDSSYVVCIDENSSQGNHNIKQQNFYLNIWTDIFFRTHRSSRVFSHECVTTGRNQQPSKLFQRKTFLFRWMSFNIILWFIFWL